MSLVNTPITPVDRSDQHASSNDVTPFPQLPGHVSISNSPDVHCDDTPSRALQRMDIDTDLESSHAVP